MATKCVRAALGHECSSVSDLSTTEEEEEDETSNIDVGNMSRELTLSSARYQQQRKLALSS